MPELTKRHFEIKELIKKHSPFDEKETSRILDKFFSSIPASVKLLVDCYQFDRKKVLDIGCGHGQSLLYWREDSEGIEIQDQMIKFVKSLKRTVHKLNVEEGFFNLKKKNYDAIYTNNLIEHLISPHLFLVRLHALLGPRGILAIGHPIVPPFLFRNLWRLLGYQGWLAIEHINFFTAKTSRLMFERAGFEVKNQYFPGPTRMSISLGKLCAPIGLHVLSVCQKIDEFKYSPKNLAELDPSWASDLKYFR